MHSYLSDGWFAALPLEGGAANDDFVVVHRLTDGRVHTLRFGREGLRCWTVGRSAAGALSIHRSVATDAGDLLARMPAIAVAAGTRFSVSGEGPTFDVLGMRDGLVRQPPPALRFVVGLELRLSDSPFGPFSSTFRVTNEGLTPSAETVEPSLLVEAGYADVLAWLHGKATMQLLLADASQVVGSLAALSSVEGVVKAPGTRLPAGTIAALVTYGAMRARSAVELDAVEDLTLPGEESETRLEST